MAEKTVERVEVVKEAPSLSHVVTLRAKPLNNHLPAIVQAEAITKLSSVFVNRQPLRGLDSEEEEKKYLAEILDVRPDDREWSKEVRKFWAELRIPVDFRGKPLEIGQHPDGTPVNLMDYIHYRFAKKHILVADSEENMRKDPRKRFYILDPQKEAQKKNRNVQVAKLADREFIKSTDSVPRMKNLLQVLSKAKLNVEKLPAETLENLLFDIKNLRPAEFIAVAQDPDLDLRAEISSFIEAGVLIKMGNSLVHMNDTIADSETEAVPVFKNPKNSGLLNILRTKYKEAIR